jgi:hypothetical protein
MSKIGLAETPKETISAPMFIEMEQDDNVARGHVRLKELIAYKATKEPRRYAPETLNAKGEIRKDKDGNILYVEIPSRPYFCQTPEQERIFNENNSDKRIETFTIDLLKSTAIKKINDPDNMEQFKEVQNA